MRALLRADLLSFQRVAGVTMAGALLLVVALRPWPGQWAARPAFVESALPPLDQARVVTAVLQGTVAPRMARIERMLAQVDDAVTVYQAAVEANGTMAPLFTQQAAQLRGSSPDLAITPVLLLSPLLALQVRSCLEDLAVASEQLALLFDDAASAISTRPFREGIDSVAYWPRVRSAVALLQRTQDWVEILDHETAAHAWLPGFAPASPPLATQLGLQ
jgi:hypothetical protein